MTPAFTRSALNKGIQMKITEFEMRGLLTGKCIPGDMKVNEQLPAYLVRKFSDLHEQLTATTNSLTNAQEALKSAGIEADTVQAGVMELKAQRDGIAALAEERRQFIVNGVETGDITLPVIDADPATVIYERCLLKPMFAHDAYLKAVRADAVVEAFVTVFDVCSRDDHIDEKLWNYGVLRVEKHADEYVAQLRAGNAGKDGV